ncbi:protein PAT1 homolog 2-like [Rhinoraja longicauda]
MEDGSFFGPGRCALDAVSSPLPPPFPGSRGATAPNLGQRRRLLGLAQLPMPTGKVGSLPFHIPTPGLAAGTQMQMRFGSPAPRSPLSPSPHLLEAFRFPEHVVQFHPQHRRLLSQRKQRLQSPSRKVVGDGVDVYANLMTDKEKAWIIKLQMIQLQSENPHLDDYYYQEYFRKLERKLSEMELGEKWKREPQKLVTPYVQKAEMYDSVVHIKGSLGQVAVSTCYSPRRAIDVVHLSAPEEIRMRKYTASLGLWRGWGSLGLYSLERRRMRGNLIGVFKNMKTIDGMYKRLLELEEVEIQLLSLPEEERLGYRELRERQLADIFRMLHLGMEGEDLCFFRILRVRKGVQLLGRLLPLFQPPQCADVLLSVATFLRTAAEENLDESLCPLFPSLMLAIPGLSFPQLLAALWALSGGGEIPLQRLLQSKFTISYLYALLSLGGTLLSLGRPTLDDLKKWTDLVFVVARELSLIPESDLAEPLELPSNLLPLFCRHLHPQMAQRLQGKILSSVSVPCPPADP